MAHPAVRLLTLTALVASALGQPAAATGLDTRPIPWEVVSTARDGDRVDVYLTLPASAVGATPPAPLSLDEALLEAISRELLDLHHAADRSVRSVMPWVVDPAHPADGWQPLVHLLPPIEPPPTREREPTLLFAQPPPVTTGQPGAGHGGKPLSGRVIYVSQSHGWYWNTSPLGRWAAQRGTNNGVVEDFVNAEAINHYLVPLLLNAGATVFTVREADMQSHMVVVDAQAGGSSQSEGGGLYEESGPWIDSIVAGYQTGLAPYQGTANPHTAGTNRAIQTVSGAASAWARWTPSIPVEGRYAVYVAYSQDSSRVTDAHYEVRHLGGVSQVRVNQQRHGATWLLLGYWRFGPGQDAEHGSVTLWNDSAAEPGDFVSADAVRFGGGMGDIERGDGSGTATSPTSGRPRWEEASRYYTQFCGAPSAIWNSVTSADSEDNDDDVSARSRYAAWQNEAGEDAIYVSWHSNATGVDGSTARGTSTYVYGPNKPGESYNFTGVPGSEALAGSLQDEIVRDLRGTFDPGWNDRGVFSAYFGEINPSHNPEMPSALLEVAFHDNAADANQLREPGFRFVLARAVYQGIVKYFAARDGVIAALLPDAPQDVYARATGPDRALVGWSAPPVDSEDVGGDPAAGYVLYRSGDGRAFDDGVPVPGGATSMEATGLAEGVPTFFRVTATNAGGESLPSMTVAVLPGCGQVAPRALLVGAFYRLDFSSAPKEDLSAFALGTIARFRQEAMNSYDYLVEHAWALAASGVPFDSAEASAVAAGAVGLSAYDFVAWQLGEESTVDETFSDIEQGLLADWLGGGGGRALLVSGAELAWDLGAKGGSGDVAFLQGWLGADYASDDADAFGLSPVPGALGGALAGAEPLSFADSTYLVDWPDVLSPVGGAQPFLTYDNGAGVAGLRYAPAQGYLAYTLGFPLESLAPGGRDRLVAAILADAGVSTLLPCDGPGPDPDPDVAPDVSPDPTPDAGPEPDPQTEPGPEVVEATPEPAPDQAPDAGPGVDLPSGAVPVVGPRTTSSSLLERRSEGCAGGGPGPSVPLALLAALAWVWVSRRQRRTAR